MRYFVYFEDTQGHFRQATIMVDGEPPPTFYAPEFGFSCQRAISFFFWLLTEELQFLGLASSTRLFVLTKGSKPWQKNSKSTWCFGCTTIERIRPRKSRAEAGGVG